MTVIVNTAQYIVCFSYFDAAAAVSTQKLICFQIRFK